MNADDRQKEFKGLQGLLAQDPQNPGLLGAVFEAALRAGETEAARELLKRGRLVEGDAAVWRLREAHLGMVRREWSQAEETLQALLRSETSAAGLAAVVRQDLAQIALFRGLAPEGIQWIEPLVADGEVSPPDDLQALWLRLLHLADRIDDLLKQAQAWGAAGVLGVEATGVTALAALDAGDLAVAKRLATSVLERNPWQREALVTAGSLELALQHAEQAKAVLSKALRISPDDGRTLSAWAFAELLCGELSLAEESFRRALAAMPGHIGTWHGLGWSQVFQRSLEAAEGTFAHAVELDRNFAESHGGLAVTHALRGDRDAAEREMALALGLDRVCMSAHYARAILDGHGNDPQFLRQLAARLLSVRGRA